MKDLKTLHKAKNLIDALQIQSILESEGIYYITKNQHVQNLFGVGQFGTGFSTLTGQIEIKVFEKDFLKSKELIDSSINIINPDEDDELSIIQKYDRYLNTAVILGLFFPGLNVIPLLIALRIKSQSRDKLGGSLRILVSTFLVLVGLIVFFKMFTM